MATWGDLLTQAQSEIGDENAVRVDVADLMRGANDAGRKIVAESRCLLGTHDTNTAGRAWTYTLPTNVLHRLTHPQLINVTYDDNPLHESTRRWLEAHYGSSFDSSATPKYFFTEATLLYLCPPPNASNTLRFVYRAMFTDMTNTTSTFVLPPEAERVVTDHVCVRAWRTVGETQKARDYDDYYLRGLRSFRKAHAHVRPTAAGQPPVTSGWI